MIRQYSLVIIPSQSIVDRVAAAKLQLRQQLGRFYFRMNSVAHITLLVWIADEKYEGIIFEEFKRILSGISPFSVELSGFGTHDETGTFFIQTTTSSAKRVIDSGEFINSKFRRSLKRLLDKPLSPQYRSPHMTIASKLDASSMAVAVNANAQFEGTFDCESFYFRRQKLENKNFEVIAAIPLLSQPMIVGDQLTLFS